MAFQRHIFNGAVLLAALVGVIVLETISPTARSYSGEAARRSVEDQALLQQHQSIWRNRPIRMPAVGVKRASSAVVREIIDDARHLLCLRCTMCCRRLDPARYVMSNLDARGMTLTEEEVDIFRDRARMASVSATTSMRESHEAALLSWLFSAGPINPDGGLSRQCGKLRRAAMEMGVDLPSRMVSDPLITALHYSHTDDDWAAIIEYIRGRIASKTLPVVEMVPKLRALERHAGLPEYVRITISAYANASAHAGKSVASVWRDAQPCLSEYVRATAGVLDIKELWTAVERGGAYTELFDYPVPSSSLALENEDVTPNEVRRAAEFISDLTGSPAWDTRVFQSKRIGDLLKHVESTVRRLFRGAEPFVADEVSVTGMVAYFKYVLAPLAIGSRAIAWSLSEFFDRMRECVAHKGDLPEGIEYYELAGLAYFADALDPDMSPSDIMQHVMPYMPGTRDTIVQHLLIQNRDKIGGQNLVSSNVHPRRELSDH